MSTVTARPTSSFPPATSSTRTSPSPAGSPKTRGSLTWWENKGEGNAFVRHDVVTGSPFSYHGVQFADLDGDGVKDLITTGEQGHAPRDKADDIVELHYFKGRITPITGERTFDPAVTLATNGGSLPVVFDVDKDGKLAHRLGAVLRRRSAVLPVAQAEGQPDRRRPDVGQLRDACDLVGAGPGLPDQARAELPW
ncbi:FG-GAP repeat domain-containing protein [Aeromicrobium sp. UC242_57]